MGSPFGSGGGIGTTQASNPVTTTTNEQYKYTTGNIDTGLTGADAVALATTLEGGNLAQVQSNNALTAGIAGQNAIQTVNVNGQNVALGEAYANALNSTANNAVNAQANTSNSAINGAYGFGNSVISAALNANSGVANNAINAVSSLANTSQNDVAGTLQAQNQSNQTFAALTTGLAQNIAAFNTGNAGSATALPQLVTSSTSPVTSLLTSPYVLFIGGIVALFMLTRKK